MTGKHFCFQFIVVGAERDTLAYTMLEMGKLRLFDVVESANDKTATELLVPGKKPQQCFDDHLLGKAHVKIRVNRSISLSPVTNMLKLGMINFSKTLPPQSI